VVTVYPSIDISKGRAVKRVKGVAGTGLDLGDPLKWVDFWASEGARGIHVVDLDAAEQGRPVNYEIINSIISKARDLGLWIQVAGGIRELEHALLYRDADAIVVGSRAHKDPAFIDTLANEIDESRIIVAIDVKGGKVSISGWRETVPLTLKDALMRLSNHKFGGIMYTYVDTEGTMKGPDFQGVKLIRTMYPDKLLEYAGGVGSKEDVKRLGERGVDIVIVGMALYTGKLKLRELL